MNEGSGGIGAVSAGISEPIVLMVLIVVGLLVAFVGWKLVKLILAAIAGGSWSPAKGRAKKKAKKKMAVALRLGEAGRYNQGFGQRTGTSFNGRTPRSGRGYWGSNPYVPASLRSPSPSFG